MLKPRINGEFFPLCALTETPIKVLITALWFVIVGSGLDQCIPKQLNASLSSSSTAFSKSMLRYFTTLERLYVFGCVPVQLYVNVIHEALFGLETLAFLPLMITSVYAAVGVIYGWLLYSASYFSPSKVALDKKKKLR